jgi:2-polyprenyl-3-methyl-5-hydroxy-6-metoxy-1,4-benzoquinol methylase
MSIVGGSLGYHILRRISADGDTGYNDGSVYIGKSKLEVLFGPGLWPDIAGKTVLDFGCGDGLQAIELAERGAKHVFGVDTYEPVLVRARENAARFGVSGRCTFTSDATEPADIILALDSFEHFSDPAAVLRTMRRLVRPGGFVLISFGPTWYHPLGGHVFSVFPWAHFIFSERAFLRWFSHFNHDGHTSFESVGLNRMTIARFKRIVEASEWQIASFEAVPIRKLRWLHNRLTREFTTSIVRCKLAPRGTLQSNPPRQPR